MNIVLINWIEGENDPFSLFNNCMAEKIAANGRNPLIVNLDAHFDQNMSKALALGVDFAITWQGLGSNLKNISSSQTIWDDLKIPLICLHGDHPCHAVPNHHGESKFISHLYATPSFAEYANKYIPRNSPAQYINIPNFFPSNSALPEKYVGDYFVLPKNLDDTQTTLDYLRQNYSNTLYGKFYEISIAIKEEFSSGNQVNHHKIIDEFLSPSLFDALKVELKTQDELALLHFVHSLTDKFFRNFVSEHILLEMSDVKIKIFGRGWERFIEKKNKNHEFYSFDKAINGDFQFQSNYGILDVAPINDSLHDRTHRAVSNKNGFLLGSSWDFMTHLNEDFSNLFYTGVKNELREKAEIVIQDPLKHRNLTNHFSSSYDKTFSFYRFLKDLENIASIKKSGLTV
jgi:hypothetical protein